MARDHYFTPSTANALLPELAEHVETIRSHLMRARAFAAEAKATEDPDHKSRVMERLDALQHELQAQLDLISGRGVEVKGVQPVLLDFPAMRHGQEVYLCWREGEGERVGFWHALHSGFSGRQKVDYHDLGAWEWEN